MSEPKRKARKTFEVIPPVRTKKPIDSPMKNMKRETRQITPRVINEYTAKREKAFQALAELDKWLIGNAGHKDFISQCMKRQSILVDLDIIDRVISNRKVNDPTHGTALAVYVPITKVQF